MIELYYPLGDIIEQNNIRFIMLDIATALRNDARLKNGLKKSTEYGLLHQNVIQNGVNNVIPFRNNRI